MEAELTGGEAPFPSQSLGAELHEEKQLLPGNGRGCSREPGRERGLQGQGQPPSPTPSACPEGTCPAVLEACHVEGVAVLLGADGVGCNGEVGVLGIGRVVLKVFQVHSQLVLLLQREEVQVLQPCGGAAGQPGPGLGGWGGGGPACPGPALPSQYSPSARPKPSL